MARVELPRLVIAGLAGDTGKTLVTLGLIRALANRGMRVAPFKKGPDFIDAAWLGAAARVPGRNLDTFLMEPAAVLGSLSRAQDSDIVVCEGNRGLFDGLDEKGTHSTAELAKLIDAPVVLVVDATKSTRTVAAQVLGCKNLDPESKLSGVIINRVGTERQEALIRKAVWETTSLPVLGAIPRLEGGPLPSRHLGLVTAVEHPGTIEVFEYLAGVADRCLDIPALLDLARHVPGIEAVKQAVAGQSVRARVGVLKDSAFSFYYPENLEALEAAGARLVPISPLEDTELPELDALYAGGGFPEVYAAALSANVPMREALARRIEQGLFVWAECGGLMYLSKALIKDGASYPMVGALPIVVEHTGKPQGHGYVRARVVGDNPFFAKGTDLRGHEFHYSRLKEGADSVETILALDRGVGIGKARDGIRLGNVVASYTHLHALGTPQWAERLVEAAVHTEDRRPYKAPDMAVSSAGVRKPRGLRKRVEDAVRGKNLDVLESLVASESRAVRYLVGITYGADEEMCQYAARGIALAGRYHPDLVQSVIRRLVWGMNDESGTHAVNAPVVLKAISEEKPELLLPMVPDLVRLSADEGVRVGITATLKTVAQACPGQVGKQLGDELSEKIRRGDYSASCSW